MRSYLNVMLVSRVTLTLTTLSSSCLSKFGNYQIRWCSSIPLRSRKGTAKDYRNQHFIDWKQVTVTGGNGGNGARTFLQLFCNDSAGPDGGDGGNGGHVIFRVNRHLNSFGPLAPLYRGEDGEKGYSNDCFGKCAKHTIIDVPVGTIVKDESGKDIVSLDVDGTSFIAARGGAGGKGNHFFLSSNLKAPKFCEEGGPGESKSYTLELKLIANIGLIGFPNAGKSTLLRAISRARPKVASYPFTTLNPHIGIVQFDDFVQMSVADLPGLIPGAHQNRGLGFSFLRHVERCACLLFVIDLSVNKPWEQFDALQYEVEQYQQGLAGRFQAIVGNKIDLAESGKNLAEWKEKCGLPILPISAKVGKNVTELVKRLRKIYDEHVERKAAEPSGK